MNASHIEETSKPCRYARDWDSSWRTLRASAILAQCNALPIRRQREAVLAAVPRGAGCAVELGAGGSAWLQLLAMKAGCVVGIDLSESGLRLTQGILQSQGVAAALARADVFHAPLRPGTCSVVFSAGLVEHFPDPSPLLRVIFELLTAGGTVITLAPNKRGLPGIMDRFLNPRTFRGHVRYTPAELAEVHAMAGLEVVLSGFVGCFTLGARAPKGPFAGFPYRVMRRVLCGIAWGLMDLMCWYPESRFTSAAIMVVGRKPILAARP